MIATAAPAAAEEPEEAPPPGFWDRAVDPHGAERKAILAATKEILGHVRATDDSSAASATARARAAAERTRILRDARGMLRYALAREPDHPELLHRAAEVADATGRSADAVALYRRSIAAHRRGAGPHAELANLHARRGELDDAIHQYRVALAASASTRSGPGDVYIALASVYMAAGKCDEAIALLQTFRRVTRRYYRDHFIQFALAVAYDRDGQVSKAHNVLSKISNQRNLIDDFLRRSRGWMSDIDLATPLDVHYFNALLFETTGMLEEARTEWLQYARSGPEARYRARALAHVRELDRRLRDQTRRGGNPEAPR